MPRITDRDAKLIETLAAFGALATRQIEELFFPGIRKTTMCRRLRTLQKKGILRKIDGLPDGSAVWTLTPRCAQDFGSEAVVRRVNRNTLEHDVLLGDVRIALTNAGVVSHWTSEYELRRQLPRSRRGEIVEVGRIPDALITVSIGDTPVVIALELERRLKSRRRYADIFHNYFRTDPIRAVWYLVPHSRMGVRLQKQWDEKYEHIKSPRFLWSAIPGNMKNLLASKIQIGGQEKLLSGLLTP